MIMKRLTLPRLRRLSTLALLCVAVAGLAACGPSISRERILDAYHRGEYEKSYADANNMVDSAGGTEQNQMRFIAGMSAYRIDRPTEAVRLLAPLTTNSDKQISGPANATLGLIHSERGQYEKALGYFNDSLPRLDGENLAQAHFYAGVTQQKLGRWADGKSELAIAVRTSNDPALREAVRQRLASTGFTLQLGAYTDPKNAEERASLLKGAITATGLGEPRVVVNNASGPQKLYLVQAGQFNTYELANKAKDRLGRNDVVISPLQAK